MKRAKLKDLIPLLDIYAYFSIIESNKIVLNGGTSKRSGCKQNIDDIPDEILDKYVVAIYNSDEIDNVDMFIEVKSPKLKVKG